ncbi:MAG: electron transfer flavoprotein subunit beta/FixA family protein [Candidatus Dormibacteria bacterium]
MKIAVCVKQIPDPSALGRLASESRRLVREGVELVLDPGDAYAVEAALQLAAEEGDQVVAISMGPESAADALRKAMAMGVGAALLVSDPRLAGSDALATARVLAAAVRRVGPDLLIAGTESTDGYTGTVPAAVAELLGWPSLTFARQVELGGAGIRIQRQTPQGHDLVESPLPAVVTVTGGINEPRYPTLKGIVAARGRPIDQPGLEELGVDPEGAGAGGRQRVVAVDPVPPRASGQVVEDDGSGAKRIADLLAELRVI